MPFSHHNPPRLLGVQRTLSVNVLYQIAILGQWPRIETFHPTMETMELIWYVFDLEM
jgi:hypothetical protein